jgi:hypothetical protein
MLLCGHACYIRWGTYGRKPRPQGVEIRIQRFFCSLCHRTCSALPAFLLGHAHYTATTVAPYVDYMAAQPSASIVQAWAHDPADGFPLDLATLYRWFTRLTFRLTFLLVMLEKELLDLAPETALGSLEKLIVQRTTIRPRYTRLTSPADQTCATASTLTLHSLCQSSSRLARQLLRRVGKLHRTSHQNLPPLMFLNFFCWQKTGQALLSPLPQKPNPP